MSRLGNWGQLGVPGGAQVGLLFALVVPVLCLLCKLGLWLLPLRLKVSPKALSFCCAPTVFLPMTVRFRWHRAFDTASQRHVCTWTACKPPGAAAAAACGGGGGGGGDPCTVHGEVKCKLKPPAGRAAAAPGKEWFLSLVGPASPAPLGARAS